MPGMSKLTRIFLDETIMVLVGAEISRIFLGYDAVTGI